MGSAWSNGAAGVHGGGIPGHSEWRVGCCELRLSYGQATAEVNTAIPACLQLFPAGQPPAEVSPQGPGLGLSRYPSFFFELIK